MSEANDKIDRSLTAEIELQFPVDFDGAHVASLTMRRPKVRDGLKAERAKGTEVEKRLAFLADLVERPVELLHELDETDLEAVQAQYLAFTGRTPTPES